MAKYRYLKTTETKWTPEKYVTGPTKGIYLTKGDQLFYYEGKGNNISVAISMGYGGGRVSVSLPLGQKATSGKGVALVAKKNGYYRIKVKKYGTFTVKRLKLENGIL